ncbi:lyase family protein [Hamadaea sp. NPDC051192]|uniref:lyase family protein n=1 Tax=Hamadaea sp. NPDC051192 TaxID=3154940 RepID=UPI00342503F6
MRPSSSPSDGSLFGGVLHRGRVADAVSDAAWVRALLDVEVALAGTTAPPPAAAAIADACSHILIDVGALGRAAAVHGNPVHPLVAIIREIVPSQAREWVHVGATTQDVLDTAAMVIARRAVVAVLDDLTAAAEVTAQWAEAYRSAPMMGRTLLQQAVPIPFGLKAAQWLSGLDAARDRLRALTFAAQLGGAAGTLAGLATDPIEQFAARLGLSAPDLPWHTERSRIADLASALGIAAGAAGKVARDVTLLAQTEIGEVTEAAPGGSTAMPHKRNPIAAVSTLAAAAQAPGLVATLMGSLIAEHERAAGAWHAEWRPLRELLTVTGSAAAWLRECLSGLTVHTDVMRAAVDRAGWPLENHASADRPFGHADAFIDAALRHHHSPAAASPRAPDQG